MTTLAQLADRAQNAISDAAAATWSQALIEEWCNEAIRDYTNYFTRQIEDTIAAVTDDRKYDLPSGFRAMIQVEYPDAQSTPEYLSPRSHTESGFWDSSGYYSIISHQSIGTPDELWISEKPTTGETIRFIYEASHNYILTSGNTVTVPAHHEHLLILFVVWKAWLERTGKEEVDTQTTTLELSQYQANTNAAEKSYNTALAAAKKNEYQTSQHATWKMDEWDRIY